MERLHKAAPDPPFLSTGCEAFDAILGAGLRSGEICEVVLFSFLPDPGVSGVRSMGPGVCLSLHTYGSFVKLC